MHDGDYRAEDRRALAAPVGLTDFAAEVVARLVAREAAGGRVLREPLVTGFMEAVRSADPRAFDRLKPELRRARISAATLADLYIPEVARRLGEAWEADCLTFAEVSVGMSRLQAILREIGAAWVAHEVQGGGDKALLLVLPTGEQHTLGAMVIAGWLRRRGISVCLRIAPSTADLVALLASRHFDGAMISIACNDKLEVCAQLVKTLKDAAGSPLPVAVGGANLERWEEVCAATGADIVTNDLPLALSALGLDRCHERSMATR